MGPSASPWGRKHRVGLVSYLNARPIGYGLTTGRQRDRFEVVEKVPSALAESLGRLEVDYALIPSIEYARAANAGREIAIVPGIAIATRGKAESVLFICRVPVQEIRTVALDRSSRSSVGVLRLLLRRRLRPGLPDPEFQFAAPDPAKMLETCDAALLIGDRALFASRDFPAIVSRMTVLDLGEEWASMTGLPFVYAIWAGPPRDDSAAVVASLRDSLEEGMGNIAAIARNASAGNPATETTIRRYLSRTIGYTLGSDEIKGLETYFRMLAEEKLLDRAPASLAFHSVSRRR
jgi:chorismate dehydratase